MTATLALQSLRQRWQRARSRLRRPAIQARAPGPTDQAGHEQHVGRYAGREEPGEDLIVERV